MKKSTLSVVSILAATVFIVNCQKAPDKRRVRPDTKGGGAAADTVDGKALPTKVCEKEVLELFKGFSTSYRKITENKVTDATSSADKKAQESLALDLKDRCDKLLPKLNAEENGGCKKDEGSNADTNMLMAKDVQGWCNAIGTILEKDHGLPNEYATAAKEAAKAKADSAQIEDLKKVTLNLSNEGKVLLTKDGVNGLAYIENGELKSGVGAVSLDNALADKDKTVCTFTGSGVEIKDEESISFKLLATTAGTKNDVKDISADYDKIITVLSLEMSAKIVEGEGSTTAKDGKTLVCLNMDSEKLSIKKIEAALGKVISSATTTVKEEKKEEAAPAAPAKEETAAKPSQADTAANQPAGSPQAALVQAGVDAGAIKVPTEDHNAHVQAYEVHKADESAKAEAKTKAQEAVTAKQEAATKANQAAEEAKAKADRVEAAAVTAEEEATKLLADSSAGKEEKDEAQQRATRLREEANAAKEALATATADSGIAASELQTAQEALEALN